MKTMSTEARCPACATALTQLLDSIDVVAGCAHCGGAWLDAASCAAVLAGRLSDGAKEFVRHIESELPQLERTAFRDAAKPVTDERNCPVCKKPLGEVHLHDANLSVDACPDHGTFFDRGELLRVADTAEAQQIVLAGARIGALPAGPKWGASRVFLWLGGATFALSMALPSVKITIFSTSTMPGVLCAAFGFLALDKDPPVALAACGNVWLLTLPFYVRRLQVGGTAFVAALATAFGVLATTIAWGNEAKDLLAGYYVWVVSFFVIALALFVRAVEVSRRPGELARF